MVNQCSPKAQQDDFGNASNQNATFIIVQYFKQDSKVQSLLRTTTSTADLSTDTDKIFMIELYSFITVQPLKPDFCVYKHC